VSYELQKAVEAHLLQLIAPLIEGSTLSKQELLNIVNETVKSIKIHKSVI